MRFIDKVDLITTGSGAGIGWAASLANAREGARFVDNSQSMGSSAEILGLLRAEFMARCRKQRLDA